MWNELAARVRHFSFDASKALPFFPIVRGLRALSIVTCVNLECSTEAGRFEYFMLLIHGGQPSCYWARTRRAMTVGTRCMCRARIGFMTSIFGNWKRMGKVMAKKFSALRARMSPQSRARAARRAKALSAEMPLHELRQARALSQVKLAEVLRSYP